MNLFSSHQEIKNEFMKLHSMDSVQRHKIQALFESQMDFGGVSLEEFDRILKEVYHNKSEYRLTDTDYHALLDMRDRLKAENS